MAESDGGAHSGVQSSGVARGGWGGGALAPGAAGGGAKSAPHIKNLRALARRFFICMCPISIYK
mgnify:CR=1 FL=1